jgi:hypothetical protein
VSAGPQDPAADAAPPGHGGDTPASGAEEGVWAGLRSVTLEVSDHVRVERIATFFRQRGFEVSVEEDGDGGDGVRRLSALRPAA